MRHLIYWIALVVVGTLSGLLLVRYHMIAGKFQNNMEDFHVVKLSYSKTLFPISNECEICM